ncbi:MAG: npdG [Acidobacteria bacterium]|nr:npdG [Acidobacteriota bacterium]
MASLPLTSVVILGGTGQQGRGLAQRFARVGLRVIVGSRDPDKARAVIAGWPGGGQPIDVASNTEAAAQSDLVVIAVPFASVDALLAEVAGRFTEGAVAIDLTVPVTFNAGKMAMLEVAEGSASEHIRARVPARVGLAAAFKTIPAHLLSELDTPLDCDEFVCGDTDEARARTVALVQLLPGLRAVDVGPLSRARSIEGMTALAIAINRRHKIHDARFRIVGL